MCATALDELQVATDAAQSPWLVPRARTVLDDFDQSIAEHVPALDSALAAVRMAPDMLGADGPRRYLLLFTTPSEARGLGGFIGSYAELTADEGRLVLSNSGHTARLDPEVEAAGARRRRPPPSSSAGTESSVTAARADRSGTPPSATCR